MNNVNEVLLSQAQKLQTATEVEDDFEPQQQRNNSIAYAAEEVKLRDQQSEHSTFSENYQSNEKMLNFIK